MNSVKDLLTLLTGLLSAMAVTLIIWLAVTVSASAAVYYPDDDTVIARWERDSPVKPTLSSLQLALDEARSLNGSAKALRHITRLTSVAISSDDFAPDMLLLKARLQQHQHAFDEAGMTLERYISEFGQSPGALLLKATVSVNQGDSTQAESACRALAGIGEPALAAICLLDVRAQLLPASKDYQQLQQLHQYAGVSSSATADGWTREILASMALDLNRPQEADAWLEGTDFTQAPLSRVALWADIQIALGQPQVILDTLPNLISVPSNVDDAILLRLAQAEKMTQNGLQWQQAMSQRVAMREWRSDEVHAAQLARYYLDVQPDPQKALQFARLNWKHGKTWADKLLLARAGDNRDE